MRYEGAVTIHLAQIALSELPFTVARPLHIRRSNTYKLRRTTSHSAGDGAILETAYIVPQVALILPRGCRLRFGNRDDNGLHVKPRTRWPLLHGR